MPSRLSTQSNGWNIICWIQLCSENVWRFLHTFKNTAEVVKPLCRQPFAYKSEVCAFKLGHIKEPCALSAGRKEFKLGTSTSNFPPYRGKGQIPHPWEGLLRPIPYLRARIVVKCPGYARGSGWMLKFRIDRRIINKLTTLTKWHLHSKNNKLHKNYTGKERLVKSATKYIYSLTCSFALLVSISILFLRIAKKASKKWSSSFFEAM